MIFVIYILCLAAIVYFLLVRPQQKRKKHQAALVAGLKAGARVVTIGGFHGVVTAAGEETVTIQGKDGSELVFDKAAVSRILPGE